MYLVSQSVVKKVVETLKDTLDDYRTHELEQALNALNSEVDQQADHRINEAIVRLDKDLILNEQVLRALREKYDYLGGS